MAWSVRLEAAAVDVVFDDLGLGRVPQPFDVPSVGATTDERARLRENVYDILERRNLARGGRLDPRCADMLTVAARGRFTISAAGVVRDEPLLASVASDGKDAVLTHQRGSELVFTEVRTTGVAAAIVGLLPSIPPARGASMSMPIPQTSPATDEEYDPFATARARTNNSAQNRGITRVFVQPRLGFGVFSASVFDDRDARMRHLCDISWWDFDQEQRQGPGRWYGHVTGNPEVLTLHPGDNGRLAHYLQGIIGPHLP